ncbi:MAG: tRNA modification GTPase MnmE [Planctomycetota bacterium]|jgi:tRNA modification GTPase
MADAAGRELIVAAATPPGGTMALVRATGDSAFMALRRLEPDGPPPTRGVRRGWMRIEAGRLPCLVACMPGPGSYTGQDTVEWVVPSNPEVVRQVTRAVRDAVPGARAAGPGAFTMRAFAAGRLSLEQVEGVAATIAARTDAELQAAAMLRQGRLGTLVGQVMEELLGVLAMLEAGIDFTDQEDVISVRAGELRHALHAACGTLRSLVQGNVPLERLASTPWVVLAGRANAGKSALFNALLGRARAVVSPVQGTTRDVLVEPWSVPVPGGTCEVLLVDAPGAMEGGEHLDRLAQSLRERAMARATITLHCRRIDDEASASVGSSCGIPVCTQADRGGAPRAGELSTSAVDATGLPELRAAVGSMAAQLGTSAVGEAPALAQRHHDLVAQALDHLQAALEAAAPGPDDGAVPAQELVAAAMHGAVEALGGVCGRVAPDDILDRIFSRFCIGK